jgi:enediyne biosynthesis protein E3
VPRLFRHTSLAPLIAAFAPSSRTSVLGPLRRTATRFSSSRYMRAIRVRLLSVSTDETKFKNRGFWSSSPFRQARLEKIGETFLGGFNCALREADLEQLTMHASKVPTELAGFFFEGAGMASTLCDWLAPWENSRFQALLEGPGNVHKYILHVGAGWAFARLPVRWNKCLAKFDPLLRWLVLDGFGFHEGYFHWQKYIDNHAPPPRSLKKSAASVFDQGLGRSLWFVTGADTDRLELTIASFPEERRSDLWAGAGLACAYAGGIDDPVLSRNSTNVPYRSIRGPSGAKGLAHVEQNLDHVRGIGWLRHQINNIPRNEPVGVIRNIATSSIG